MDIEEAYNLVIADLKEHAHESARDTKRAELEWGKCKLRPRSECNTETEHMLHIDFINKQSTSEADASLVNTLVFFAAKRGINIR